MTGHACWSAHARTLARAVRALRGLGGVLLGVVLILGIPTTASAQYIYIDTNGNGVSDAGDILNTAGPTPLDLWLDTAANRDGSPSACTATGFSSYDFILRAQGGTVTWGSFTNDLTSFTIPLGVGSTPTEYHNGFAGPGSLSVGLYRIGTLTVEVESGDPCLVFASSTSLSPCFFTSFGSSCVGGRFDHTLRLGSDWFDSDGTASCAPVEPGSVSGSVRADCPATGTGLLGVTVDAFQVGTGDLVASAVTDQSGDYQIDSLAAGDYIITLVVPLGYTAASAEIPVAVPSGGTVTANFNLTCVEITANPRTIGFWKHQVGVALGGTGSSQIDAATLCGYLDLIETHFNNNALNQVIIYQPPASATCADKLAAAKILLNLPGSGAMIDRARQQLMALLLNVAASFISQTNVISADGATVTQAITYCDNLIDAAGGDHEKAKSIADEINNGKQVGAGVIPLGTQSIAYANRRLWLRVTPNRGQGPWTFGFALGARSAVSLQIFDVSGRRVATVYQGVREAGVHALRWNGRGDGGGNLASGIYLARLFTESGSTTNKLLVLRP